MDWISVNDWLPEKGYDVLVLIQDKDNHFHTEIRWRSLNDDVIVDDNGFAIYPPAEERVLAWMPVPVYKVAK